MDPQPRQPLPQPVSADEKLAAFDSVPLFMKTLPEDVADNPIVGALQSLAYEGTPDDVAQNFKEQGNDYFKGKRYREAVGFYTQGIDAKPTDVLLLEALLCNRAACNLELKNFGSVLKDCSRAILTNPKSSKAHYRSALALIQLERYDEAIDCCDRCLCFDKDNKDVRTLRERARQEKMIKDKKERERQNRLRREVENKKRLEEAFKERNLVVIPRPDGSSENPYAPTFDPEDTTGSTLIVPVFFLYPQYATSDVISQFVEDTAFSSHLAAMFPPEAPPPEWDNNHDYVADRLVVYATTHHERLLKVGKKMTLKGVFNAARAKEGEPVDGLELKDGCLTFVVLPKGDVEQKWVEEFKRNDRWAEKCVVSIIDDGDEMLSGTRMSLQHKISRTANAPTTPPDELEISIAQALIDLENHVPELKTELKPLQISAAREVDVRGGKKAIVIFVPVPQLKAFHKVQQRLTRELEKKFSDRHVVFVAQRRMLRKPTRTSRVKQKRPRSRTLTNVHEKVLEDLVFPGEIIGKRTRVAIEGSKTLKVFLDSKDSTSLEYKLDSFSSVYRRLTGKEVTFEFPPQTQE
ncbi:40S ribosomal protein S7 [Laetiporus sulphureus 93-53]|uniref:40S ribosomal protein S7 n=1 Tax=Laetiporus sulphureus 93-53 TaxID=1314785 RepID=A0A165I9R7_9APHY|nr:40S ribosomal protein S7 [Laetiporus sulphureus 93-53]KZT12778.1 40S ribosomal protein S7 [Laetiporus sulphureus 93-53]